MANVTYTVPNKNGSYDGDMVVKQYTSINIDAGDTVTVDQPCRGLMILCQGDCTINGTLSMKEKGANANPSSSGGSDSNAVQTNGLQLPFLTTSGSDTLTASNTLLNGCGTLARSVVANFKSISGTGNIITVPKVGGAGGTAGGSAGSSVTNGTGGGGSGNHQGGTTTARGGNGTCFSGGSGSGGNVNGSSVYGTDDYAGAGGAGGNGSYAVCTLGGAGNPAGTTVKYFGGYSGGNPVAGGGTGGLLILIVSGTLTIGSGGKITVKGGDGAVLSDQTGSYSGQYASGGGHAGGGRIIIAHKGTYTNNGTVESIGGDRQNANGGHGGNGGTGALTVQQID
jgi:hypothetical protein